MSTENPHEPDTMSMLDDMVSKVTLRSLVAQLLDQNWHVRCRIIPAYMPRYPQADTKPSCVAAYVWAPEDGDGRGSCDADGVQRSFLRWSKGPRQGFFWDVYGDDFKRPELALLALAQASCPDAWPR